MAVKSANVFIEGPFVYSQQECLRPHAGQRQRHATGSKKKSQLRQCKKISLPALLFGAERVIVIDVRVAIGTIEFTDDERRMLADRIGQKKLYTREQCRNWVLGIVEGELDSMAF